MHAHSIAYECTPACPAHDPKGWRCASCRRQVPMLADTEAWEHPLCAECFDGLKYQPTILNFRFGVSA